MKKVSVIIPAFNCAATVKESALSALEDNKDSVAELVFVDDKSTDETLSILRVLEEDYPSMKNKSTLLYLILSILTLISCFIAN